MLSNKREMIEFGKPYGLSYSMVYRHMKVGQCQWPRLKMNGNTKNPAYKCWEGMKQRCTNPKNPKWALYGERGITVCTEWSKSFESFINDMGERPSMNHSLDRIDGDGNYEPGNVRWADDIMQCYNRDVNIEKRYNNYRFRFNKNSYKAKTLKEAQLLKIELYKSYIADIV